MKPFLLPDGSESLVYYTDDNQLLRQRMPLENGYELAFPCEKC